MSEETIPQVGEYWMHRGTPVRVSDVNEHGRFGISYVQIIEYGPNPDVIGGGHSFSWPASEFHPITDPYLLAACKVYEGRREAHDHKVLGARAEADVQKWLSVMEVLHAGQSGVSASPEPK